ncbi:MAG: GFA family protein [Gammaproteobacteria bacterium]|nr:GFA family protein [Gammaproteobacteria bacterium]
MTTTESTPLAGGCLCGRVRYQSRDAPQIVGHCFCVDCRKSSATGHGTHVMVPEAGFSLSGELKFFASNADSGNEVRRGFCPNCGCAIYSTNSGMSGVVVLRASSLDDPNGVQPGVNVYTSRAPSWDPPDPSLPGFAEMPEGGIPAELAGR